MYRTGIILVWMCLFGCGDRDADSGRGGFTYDTFSEKFREAGLPYHLSDTALLRNRDTVRIRPAQFDAFLPDSVEQKVFPRSRQVSYIPLVRFDVPEEGTYHIIKVINGSRRMAMLVVFDTEGNYASHMTFLAPDSDAATAQVSSIDRSHSISKTVFRTSGATIHEGKNVYAYSKDTRQFSLIMTDRLNDRTAEVINPIDTLPKTHKLAGDYVRDKRNYVSIRNGRSDRQLMAFIHIEKNEGECVGELKGEILMTSATTAIYRQGADPCALQFSFRGSTVTLKEEQGCGNHRGINCPFEGSFTKKKPAKPKSQARSRGKRVP
ncbi:MAG TPA: hypothetical protein VFZ78_05005 [Flavisolibacter sp.]